MSAQTNPSSVATIAAESTAAGEDARRKKPAKGRPLAKREPHRADAHGEGYFQSQLRAQALAPQTAVPTTIDALLADLREYLPEQDVRHRPPRLRLRRERPRRPVPAHRPPVHHPSPGSGQHPGFHAHGLPIHRRGDHARRARRHRRFRAGAGRQLRHGSGAHRRRRLQARHHLQIAGRGAGRELPEDGHGHGQRSAR